jgi:hypothetical protein
MRPVLYPALVAAWLVLVQWRQAGASSAALMDLLTSLAAAVLLALAGWLAAVPLTPDRDRRALLALLPVLWVSLYSTFVAFAGSLMPLSPAEAPMLWTVLLLLAGVALRRAPVQAMVTRTLTIAVALLLGLQVAALGRELRPAARGPIVVTSAPRSADRPDVYLIVLDKYSSNPWLRSVYGHDNGPFEDSLRTLGFFVPRASRTNYAHTGLVLASMMNGRPVHEMITEPRSRWPAVHEKLEDARAWEFFKARGYRFFFFPSTYPGTVENRNADRTMARPVPEPPRPALTTWRKHAPFGTIRTAVCLRVKCPGRVRVAQKLFPYPLESSGDLEWKFSTLATLPDSAGPIIAFAHILAPHEPYQFDAACRHLPPWWPNTDAGQDAEVRKAYAAQVNCVNTMVLRTVRELLARSAVPPIILIQGDHGHGRLTRDAMMGQTVPKSELTSDQLRERLDVFAAYRADGLEAQWYETISPMNVLPLVLNERFGAGWTVNADRSWWSDHFADPLRLQPVTDAELGARVTGVSRGARPSP